MKLTASKLKDILAGSVDEVSRKKNGNFVIRRGYFYAGKADEDTMIARAEKALEAYNVSIKVVDKGDHWAEFKGSAPLKRQSHWYAEFEIAQ